MRCDIVGCGWWYHLKLFHRTESPSYAYNMYRQLYPRVCVCSFVVFDRPLYRSLIHFFRCCPQSFHTHRTLKCWLCAQVNDCWDLFLFLDGNEKKTLRSPRHSFDEVAFWLQRIAAIAIAAKTNSILTSVFLCSIVMPRPLFAKSRREKTHTKIKRFWSWTFFRLFVCKLVDGFFSISFAMAFFRWKPIVAWVLFRFLRLDFYLLLVSALVIFDGSYQKVWNSLKNDTRSPNLI